MLCYCQLSVCCLSWYLLDLPQQAVNIGYIINSYHFTGQNVYFHLSIIWLCGYLWVLYNGSVKDTFLNQSSLISYNHNSTKNGLIFTEKFLIMLIVDYKTGFYVGIKYKYIKFSKLPYRSIFAEESSNLQRYQLL